jgi:hypothetical protein
MTNGWHQVTLRCNSAGNPTPSGDVITVRWRTQRHRCCGRDLILADSDKRPFWIDQSRPYYRILPRPVQCPNCGTVATPTYTIREE